jgi:hypothetical protein
MRDPLAIDATVVISWPTYCDFFFVLRERGIVCIVLEALGGIEELVTMSFGLRLNRAELDLVLAAWQG